MLTVRRGTSHRSPHSFGAARPTVAIVGSGASGMLVAAQLLRTAASARAPVRVVLIDGADRSGGIAYSTRDMAHRLNVTAARMSAIPDDVDHFVRWRATTTGVVNPGEYVPRVEYRRYLEDLLTASRTAAPDATLTRLVADVEAVEPSADHVRLQLAGDRTLDADAAVLALGNLTPLPPAGCGEVAAHRRYVNNPWTPGALDCLDARGELPILLIGTGLTMVDVAMTIASRCPAAKILAVSRNGLLPRAHIPGRIAPLSAPATFDLGIPFPDLVDTVVARSTTGDPGWQQLVDELRPFTQALWKRLTLAEQADFLATRHRAWCTRRHRMPPEVAAVLAERIGSGRLAVRSGAVELAATPKDGLAARLSGAPAIEVALAVNCTGPGLDPRQSHNPLVVQLLADGHARPHPLNIGFDTAPNGAFVSRDGTPSQRLLTLGPPRIGELYETTAIPEIRNQAQELAATLTATLDRARPPVPLAAGLT